MLASPLSCSVNMCCLNLIAVSNQFEYDPDELATKITTQLVHKNNSQIRV